MANKPMVWMDGKMVEQDKAYVPLMAHALHYGSGVFEGIRLYDTKKGRAIFRLQEHIVRLFNSSKILDMKIPYTVEELCEATREVVRQTKTDIDYIRPIAYYGLGEPGKIVLNPSKFKVNVAVATAKMGSYMGKEQLEKGASIMTSSWEKPSNKSTSLQAKICGNYVNSVIAKIESNQHGADEALMLNSNGTVAEGPGENMFIVRGGKLITPPISAGVLEGITKDSVLVIANDLKIEVIERDITRGEIFNADEFFMTGTAAEVTPCSYLDGRMIGDGKAGPVTKKLQAAFFKAARGQDKKYEKWLDYVDQ